MSSISDGTDKISKALAVSQAAMKKAVKDSKNPFFKSDFASLEAVLDACLPAFNANEIFISQQTEALPDRTILHTTLFHSSGQWISSSYPIHPTKNDPQAMGSAISYARRYALEAIVSMGTTSDDDGEVAMDRSKSAAPKPTKPAVEAHAVEVTRTDKPSPAQLKRLFAIMHSARWTEEELKAAMRLQYDKESTKDLNYKEYDELCKIMVTNPAKANEHNYSGETPH